MEKIFSPGQRDSTRHVHKQELFTRQGYDIIKNEQQHRINYTSKPHDRCDMAGSDGSVDPITGDRASASAVHFKGIRHLARQRYTPNKDATSYRAELEGIYTTFRLCKELGACGLSQICDNEEAVNKVKEDLTPKHMTSPEADIILACKEIMKEILPEPELDWIRGHQDKKHKKKYEELPDKAQLNLDMDVECDEEQREGNQLEVTPLKGSGAMLSIDGRYITTNYNNNIQEAIMSKKHKKYFLEQYEKKGLTANGYNSIA